VKKQAVAVLNLQHRWKVVSGGSGFDGSGGIRQKVCS
jgi:hypothetical protein